MELLYILIPVTIVCLANFLIFKKRVTVKELLCQFGGIALLMTIMVFGCSASKKIDTEVLNGNVTSKVRKQVHCRHSYDCNCRTYQCGTKESPSTCRKCDTCYEHSYDVDWNVYAHYGMGSDDFRVDTIDRQGLQEPPRWTQFRVGDPYMTTHTYDNYVKASADTIFKTRGYQEKYKSFIPAYPMNISDYYTRLDRAVTVGNVSVPDLATWNAQLTAINATLGPRKQCNILILFTPGLSEEYFYALKEAWVGGKKNDIVVMMDVAADGTIKWTNTLAWAKEDIMRVKLRDDILAIGKLDREAILKVITVNVDQYFKRKSMKEFKYLDKSIILSHNEFMGLLVFALILSIGISFLITTVDFEQGSSSGFSRFG